MRSQFYRISGCPPRQSSILRDWVLESLLVFYALGGFRLSVPLNPRRCANVKGCHTGPKNTVHLCTAGFAETKPEHFSQGHPRTPEDTCLSPGYVGDRRGLMRQTFTFHATEEVELHVVVAHFVVLLVGEDVAVVELVVLLVGVEVVFEFAMKKRPRRALL